MTRFPMFKQQVMQAADSLEEPFTMDQLINKLRSDYSLRNVPSRNQAAGILRVRYVSERDKKVGAVVYRRREGE